MNIKGTAVKATQEYIKSNFEDKYDTWLEKLPEETKKIFTSPILASNFYPLKESVIIPTQLLEELFFEGDIEKLAFEMGKDSAIQALKGIYKIFVKIASVSFVLKRAKSIFSTYYQTGEISIIKDSDKVKIFDITGFSQEESLMFYRIDGWFYGIFDVINKHVNTVTHIIEPIENSKLVKSVITVKL